MPAAEPTGDAVSAPRAGFWKRQLRQWHWISSALCLMLVLLFAITGITLNHADTLEAEGNNSSAEYELPAPLVAELSAIEDEAVLTRKQVTALRHATGIDLSGRVARNEYGEMYFDLARPGRTANLTLDLNEGRAYHEVIDRGTIAMLNDLHKGRDTGAAWALFIDVFAVACLVFALTGLALLVLHARNRRMTWPLVSLGLLIPLILALIFIH